MAKKRARGADRALTRADLKALERRATSARPIAVHTAVAEAAEPAAPAAPPRQGVLPPRASRALAGAMMPSREQEIAYIRGDLQRLAMLAALMVGIIVVLAIFLR